ncbi:pilus (MSHA type) biogenesis protein MshL [Luteimonas sp BLCC-B24]|uniref:pilus (MSHA type) biogenesis protein MshL n=1 Tax=Luteimonas sp. BLCC-B24 TaxID=3025317 RepID=UPI00234C2B58|nr:pilus (MSHA type) biogenesis protein MshL [Luteimonas sp. BLCC-B24]MDC7805922.1 pilus (MSHA type) biogenesis protein MshL [Luteimonas sp. BLCC-B24]
MNHTATQPRRHPLRPDARVLAGAIGLALLAGCAGMPPRSVSSVPPVEYKALERANASTVEESRRLADHQELLRQQIERSVERAAAPAPPVAPAYDPLENSVVSISMFNADVGQLLWALADELNMNLIVDPQVLEQRQRTSLHLRNVSAREVYNHILDAFDLHGETRGGALVVGQMRDRILNVDLLNSTTSIDLSTGGDVFGAGMQGEGGGGQSLRGNLTMSGSVGKGNDPYAQLDAALKVILGTGPSATGGTRDPDAPLPPETARYSLDAGSGTLFVRARPSQIRAVEELVEHTIGKMRRQVLVEAQILDVSLSDNFQYGVDWNLLRNRVAGLYGDSPATIVPAPGTPGNPDLGIPADPNLLPYQRFGRYGDQARNIVFPNQSLGSAIGRGLGVSYLTDTFSAALQALRGFGNVKVLSNPSVRVRNGSPAYLSVGSNIRYVTKSTTSFSNAGGGGFNTSSDIQTDSLFSGVVIGVAPVIHENGTVELLVHPMQTEVVPGSLALREFPNGNAVTLPVINVKGITTTLNLRDGDTVLLGGLIDQTSSLDDSGIPALSDVPVLGKLFGARSTQQNTRELVLVLRVTLV